MDCRAIASSGMPDLVRSIRSQSSDLMSPTGNLGQNDLLAALTRDEQLRLRSHLELIPMTRGQVLRSFGDAIRHVYFPTTSILSMLYVMEDGSCSETAVIG